MAFDRCSIKDYLLTYLLTYYCYNYYSCMLSLGPVANTKSNYDYYNYYSCMLCSGRVVVRSSSWRVDSESSRLLCQWTSVPPAMSQTPT